MQRAHEAQDSPAGIGFNPDATPSTVLKGNDLDKVTTTPHRGFFRRHWRKLVGGTLLATTLALGACDVIPPVKSEGAATPTTSSSAGTPTAGSIETATASDILSQLKKNDRVALLLSNNNNSARQTLIQNYMSTDIPSIKTLIGNGITIGLPSANIHFGQNEGFRMDRTGNGFVLIAVDGGLVTKQDGSTSEVLLLPVNQKDPVHSAWYALFVTPDTGFKILGGEIAISSSGSHTTLGGKSVEPDQFMTDEQGKLVALGFVTNGYKGDRYIGPFPTTIAAANAKLGAWIMNPRGTMPESVVPVTSLNNDTVSNAVPATYDQLTGFN